jgi:rod shape determining protein RodA
MISKGERNMLTKFKIESKIFKQIDLSILVATILIVLFGILNIYAATKAESGFSFAKKQLIWLGLSIIATYLILLWDYALLKGYVEILYWGSIVLLIITRFAGKVINGARGWLVIGGFSIQPAELMKFAMILMLAKKLEQLELKVNDWKNFFMLAGYAVLPMAIIVAQPDMGMTMVCFFIALGIFFCAGLDMKVIGGGLLGVIIAIIIVWNSGVIKPYQKQRLVSFLNPEADELNTGLQLTQSMIGIGSGGFFGTGIDLSKEAVSRSYVVQFVPEKQTDFIFAVIGEHWGTLGGICLLALYSLLIYRILINAKESKDIFGSIICAGLASYFLFAILQNIGMTIGIMPITGITLPLVSYGGSSLFTTIVALAVVLNISMRKKKIYF